MPHRAVDSWHKHMCRSVTKLLLRSDTDLTLSTGEGSKTLFFRYSDIKIHLKLSIFFLLFFPQYKPWFLLLHDSCLSRKRTVSLFYPQHSNRIWKNNQFCILTIHSRMRLKSTVNASILHLSATPKGTTLIIISFTDPTDIPPGFGIKSFSHH